MTEPGRPRSHRGELESPVLQRVVPPVAAVAVVVIVILLLIWINGNSPGKGPGAGVISGTPPSTVAITPSTAPDPSPTATANPPGAVVASSAPARTRTASASQTPSPAQSGSHPPAEFLTARAPVVVLNNSTIAGLAASVAAQLRANGWHVRSVGNAQGRFPQTTLYYAAGLRGPARHLAHDFGSIQAVHAAAGSGVQLRGHVLTLIVTRYWQ